ncbi:MAG: hypothetical protein VYE27_07645 [Pseudomonadota bacterium]|nr:hypothetical protein [Pseudomonadota bacterium]
MKLSKSIKILFLLIFTIIWSSNVVYPHAEINSGKLINNFSNRVMDALVSMARTKAEISYDSVNYNPTLGQLSISNLRVIPSARSMGRSVSNCFISIGTLSFSFYREEFASVDSIGLELNDVKITPSCLPPTFRGGLAIAGIRELYFPALQVELAHHFPSSGTTIMLIGSLHGAAALTLDVDLSYISVTDNTDFPFLVKLRSFELSIDNKGLWENIAPQLPPAFTTPGVASATLAESFRNNLNSQLPSEIIENTISAFSPAIDGFLSNPKRLILRSQIPPEQPLLIEVETFQKVELFLNSVRPILISNDDKSYPHLPLEKIKSVVSGDIQALSDAELLLYSRFFIQGTKVPKNTKLARKMLSQLVKKDVRDALKILVELEISDHNFEEAYYNAIQMGIYGNTSYSGLVNRLESELTLEAVIEIQNKFLSPILEKPLTSDTDFFEKANSHLNGSGAIKSYLGAYYYALLARANGSVGADLIISKVEKISSQLSNTSLSQWLEKMVVVQTVATSRWLELQ